MSIPRIRVLFSVLVMSLLFAPTAFVLAQGQAAESGGNASFPTDSGGPIRLRNTSPELPPSRLSAAQQRVPASVVENYEPGEFENFVRSIQAGQGPEVRRLGAGLMTTGGDALASELSPVIPPDYVIAPDDEVLLTIWGSVDADLRLRVDRSGRISIPRVGAVQVGGVAYADLQAVVSRRISQVFKNFQLSVALGQLRGVRVFVTGFVVKPGTYTVGALSTVVSALMRSGGPSAAGSFRRIELRRGSSLVARIDLYDLLLHGDRSGDRVVQAGDVVHVGAVGVQVGVIGSVNHPVIVELLPGEGVSHALAMAGGFSAVADRSRLTIERLQERAAQRVALLSLPQDVSVSLSQGDVIRAFSATEVVLSIQNQNKRVRVDGEVRAPGEYVLPPQSTLSDALQAAGGLTPAAYVAGAHFTRTSVRVTQQENYERALRDLEIDVARASSSQRVSSTEQAGGREAQAMATSRLISRLRELRPTGRVVLQAAADGASALPQLALEDGDRLYIPPRPTTVGVFGSVFNSGSYIYGSGRQLEDYLRLAGGPTKGADTASIFVIRASGQVISERQQSSGFWFGSNGKLGRMAAEPGDTVFVPEEMDKTNFIQSAKDWTQILYQFGIGIAGINSVIR